MAPVARRPLLAFVLIAFLLSCAATARGWEMVSDAAAPMIEIPMNGLVQTSSEGFLEERLLIPNTVSSRLKKVAIGESARLSGWPVSPGYRRTIRVKRVSVYAPGASIIEIGAEDERSVPRSIHRHFVGSVEGEADSSVLLILDPASGRLTGLALSGGLSYDLAQIPGGSPFQVRVVATHERVAESDPMWDCADVNQTAVPIPGGGFHKTTVAKAGGPLEAVLAIETDTELMSQKFGGSTSAATNYIADLIAAMNVMYSRDLGITLVQGTTYLRTGSDPYVVNSNGAVSSAELAEFGGYWGSNYGSVDRALVAMLSGKSINPNSASGRAWVGGLCSNNYGYSFSKVFKINYLSGDAKLVGHEIGHNFGSPHTHCYNPPIDTCYTSSGCYSGATSCPGGAGTVMSYCHLTGCGSTLDFHPTTVNHILNNYVAPATGVCIFEATAAGDLFDDDFEFGNVGAWSSSSP